MLPVKRKMYAANNEGINILGATFVRLSGTDSHELLRNCRDVICIRFHRSILPQ